MSDAANSANIESVISELKGIRTALELQNNKDEIDKLMRPGRHFDDIYAKIEDLYMLPEWTENDFVVAQRIDYDIIDGMSNSFINKTESRFLVHIHDRLLKKMRRYLRSGGKEKDHV